MVNLPYLKVHIRYIAAIRVEFSNKQWPEMLDLAVMKHKGQHLTPCLIHVNLIILQTLPKGDMFLEHIYRHCLRNYCIIYKMRSN